MIVLKLSIDRKSTRLNSSHSLHDALPILDDQHLCRKKAGQVGGIAQRARRCIRKIGGNHDCLEAFHRSEEHTSELQSLSTRRSSDLGRPASLPKEGWPGGWHSSTRQTMHPKDRWQP